MPNQSIDIFEDSPCLSVETLYRYAQDNIADHEQHQLEAHLLECELCAHALEEVSEHSQDTIAAITASVNQKVAQRTGLNSGIAPLHRFTRVAAAIILLAGIAATLLWLNPESDGQSEQSIAASYVPRNSEFEKLTASIWNDSEPEQPVADTMEQEEVEPSAPKSLPAPRPRIESPIAETPVEERIAQESAPSIAAQTDTIHANVKPEQPEPLPIVVANISQRVNLGLKKRKDKPAGAAYGNFSTYQSQGMPQFPGGDKALIKAIVQGMNLSDEQRKTWVGTQTTMQIRVDGKGRIKEVTNTAGTNKELNQLAVESARKLPDWKRATVRGKKGQIQYTLRINVDASRTIDVR